MNYLDRKYTYFLTVAEHGSISAAARSIHISQPALTLAMKQLETEMGFSLFEKDGRRNTLSSKGAAFAEGLKKGRNLLEDQCHRALKSKLEEPIRFGVVTHWALKSVVPKISKIASEFGSIQSFFGYSMHIYDQVKSGNLDFGLIAWSGIPKWPHRVFLRDDPEAIVGLKGKYESIKKVKDLEDLKTLPWIWHRKPQKHFRDYVGSLEPALVVDSYELLKPLLFQGWGIASVQLEFFNESELKKLVVSPFSLDRRLGLYLIFNKGLDSRKQELMNFISKLV